MISRRDFIKSFAVFSTAVLNPLRGIKVWSYREFFQPREEIVGELYAGFILLPDGAPIPNFVQPPKSEPPILCGVGDNHDPTATTKSFSSISEMRKNLEFPIYSLEKTPTNLELLGGHLVIHTTGEIYSSLISFGVRPSHLDRTVSIVSLWAFHDITIPYPLWFSDPLDTSETQFILEKVNFLPAPGIMTPTSGGYVFYWIMNEILYSIAIDPADSFDNAINIINSLKLV